MFVAAWRYSTAFALVAGALTQPALAHGRFHSEGLVRHHQHNAAMRGAAVHRFARSRVARRGFAMVEAPAMQPWSEQSAPFMATSYQYGAPARRGRHRALAQAWQASWQSAPQQDWQNGWREQPQQIAWQQDYGAQTTWRQPTYPYQSQYSWSSSGEGFGGRPALGGMIAQAASAAGVPLSLAERVVRRESGGNPRAMHAGNYGLMQIRLGTARAMGYGGSASGLLDPSVNMSYAMRYLAGAYRAAGGNESRAVALYARGYRATPARVQTYTF